MRFSPSRAVRALQPSKRLSRHCAGQHGIQFTSIARHERELRRLLVPVYLAHRRPGKLASEAGISSSLETTHHTPYFLAVLQPVSAPLKKADLQVIAQYLVTHLSYNQVPALAKRHKRSRRTPIPRTKCWQSRSTRMTRTDFASCFWKSPYWIRLISDPQPTATTFS